MCFFFLSFAQNFQNFRNFYNLTYNAFEAVQSNKIINISLNSLFFNRASPEHRVYEILATFKWYSFPNLFHYLPQISRIGWCPFNETFFFLFFLFFDIGSHVFYGLKSGVWIGWYLNQYSVICTASFIYNPEKLCSRISYFLYIYIFYFYFFLH